MTFLKTRLAAGFLLLLPIGITYFVVRFIFDTLDGVLGPLVGRYNPFDVPGMGFVALIILAFVLGTVAASRAGRAVLDRCELAITVLPMIGSLYKAAKGVSTSFGSDASEGFSTVVWVNYPNDFTHSLGFLVKRLEDNWNVVYIPSTPMPNTGVMVIVRSERLVRLRMSAARAMQLIVSAGATASVDEFVPEPDRELAKA